MGGLSSLYRALPQAQPPSNMSLMPILFLALGILGELSEGNRHR
jgi:hypothetical protein